MSTTAGDDFVPPSRPRTRGECQGGERPCPWVSCKHHLYLEVSPSTGAVHINQPGVEVENLVESCVLDVTDRGGMTLDEISKLFGLTRERIRQLEAKAMKRIEKRVRALDAAVPLPRPIPAPKPRRRLYVLQAPTSATPPRPVEAPPSAPVAPVTTAASPQLPVAAVIEARDLPSDESLAHVHRQVEAVSVKLPAPAAHPTPQPHARDVIPQAPKRLVEQAPPASPGATPRVVHAIMRVRRIVAPAAAPPASVMPLSPTATAPSNKTPGEAEAARIAALLPKRPPRRARAGDDEWPLWERA